MKLLDIFPQSHLLMDLKARDKKSAIKEIVQLIVDAGTLSEDAGRKLERAVNKREVDGSTGIGKGLAIPHAKDCKFMSEVVAAYARSKDGINFDSVDGSPVHLLFMVASPVDLADKHLAIMRKIATLHKDDKTLKFLKTTDSNGSVLEILKELDDTYP